MGSTKYFNMVYHMRCSFLFSTEQCTRHFLKLDAQSSGLTVNCSPPLHINMFFSTIPEFYLKELLPNTHFYKALYSKLSRTIGITFTCPIFQFKIDHDDGTVTHFWSHLLARQEPYIDSHFIYRHRLYCYSDCQLIFYLFINDCFSSSTRRGLRLLLNSQKQKTNSNGHWKVPYCLKNRPCILHFSPIPSRQYNAMSQLLIYNTDYSGSYRPFRSTQLQWMKVQIFTYVTV